MIHVRSERAAFTLIELLVVIAIIGILIALTAGAVNRVRATQVAKATEATIDKLASALDRHMKAVIDQAKKEEIPANVVALAGSDSVRARIIWTKLRLKQEFPQTFAEALAPAPGYLAPKPTYKRAFTTDAAATLALPSLGSAWESAICLAVALEERRSGVEFNMDQLGPTGSATLTLSNGRVVTIAVDAWNSAMPRPASESYLAASQINVPTSPLVYVRSASGGGPNNELNSLPYTDTAQPTARRDRQDPEGTIYRTTPTPMTGANLATLSGLLGYPITLGTAQYVQPVIFSIGPDLQAGLNGQLGAATAAANDNLYSYRLRSQDRRGD
jgi:prepilin-type N-terminal cleavage/methylation domain-containing protein